MILGKDHRTTPQIRKAYATARTRLLAAVKAMQDAGMGEMRYTAVVEAVDSGSAPPVVREYHDAWREETAMALEFTYRTGRAP